MHFLKKYATALYIVNGYFPYTYRLFNYTPVKQKRAEIYRMPRSSLMVYSIFITILTLLTWGAVILLVFLFFANLNSPSNTESYNPQSKDSKEIGAVFVGIGILLMFWVGSIYANGAKSDAKDSFNKFLLFTGLGILTMLFGYYLYYGH